MLIESTWRKKINMQSTSPLTEQHTSRRRVSISEPGTTGWRVFVAVPAAACGGVSVIG